MRVPLKTTNPAIKLEKKDEVTALMSPKMLKNIDRVLALNRG